MKNVPQQQADIIAQKLKPISLPSLPGYPLVSVLTPNYNHARLIDTTIESVQSQTCTNWEMIVCVRSSTASQGLGVFW